MNRFDKAFPARMDSGSSAIASGTSGQRSEKQKASKTKGKSGRLVLI